MFHINTNVKAVNESEYRDLLLSASSNIWFTSDLHFGHANIIKYCVESRHICFDGKTVMVDGVEQPITREMLLNIRDDKAIECQLIAIMDDFLIEQWNQSINENDVVFLLGDVFIARGSPSQYAESQQKMLERLNGKIIMIEGNHDYGFYGNRYNVDDALFGRYQQLDIDLPIKMKNDNGEFELLTTLDKKGNPQIVKQHFVLSHYPIANWNKMNSGSIHLYGHLHDKPFSYPLMEEQPELYGAHVKGDLNILNNAICVCWDNLLRPVNIQEIMEMTKS